MNTSPRFANASPLFASFAADEPAIAEWLNTADFDFAHSLRNQVIKKGYLSPNQTAAALRCIQRDTERAAAASRPAPSGVDTAALERVFAVASGNGLKKPAITVGAYRFSPAPATGKNPGAIYVQGDGAYLGKMLGGRFVSYAAADVTAEVLAIAGDPLGAAVNHGKLTGRCAICMRKLSDPESTARGIGPICAEKFGW